MPYAILCLVSCLSFGTVWNFEDAPLDQLPSGWVAARTGVGAAGAWKVVAYESAGQPQRALAQTSSQAPDAMFNLCVLNDVKHADVDLSVRVKAVSGAVDQGGGIVWRYRDPNHYYVARWNPLEDNFRVYYVAQGQRKQLGSVKVTLPTDAWHTVRAVQVGNRIRCYLDGKLLLEAEDATLPEAGAIGLWCKADAVTWFDDLVQQLPPKE